MMMGHVSGASAQVVLTGVSGAGNWAIVKTEAHYVSSRNIKGAAYHKTHVMILNTLHVTYVILSCKMY